MDEVYREYATPVYKYLYTLTGSADLAEELTQETFYQALISIHRYNGQCKLLVWLCQIGKHLYFDHLKKEKRRGKTVDWDRLDCEPLTLEGADPQNTLAGSEGVRALYAQLHRLPEPYKEVMLLRISGELSFRDIGEIMDQNENWARVTFYRAKTKLLKGRSNDE